MAEKLIRETQVDLSRINGEIDAVNTRIDGLGKVFNYKGRVDSIEDLPSTGNDEGDLYLVGPSTDPDKAEYFWDGAKWEYLGNTSNQNNATTDAPGIIELATKEEALTGTDASKAITPYTLKAMTDKKADLVDGSVPVVQIPSLPYLPTSGGTVNGNVDIQAALYALAVRMRVSNELKDVIRIAGTTTAIGDVSVPIVIRCPEKAYVQNLVGGTHYQILDSRDKAVPNGVASLGADGKVPDSQLPASSSNAVQKTGDTMTGALKVPTADLSVADTTVVNREWAENKEQTRITNCLTKIPQDIKVELSSEGKLVLKSGSKIYKASGTFITTSQDISLSYGNKEEGMFIIITLNNLLWAVPARNVTSGNVEPSVTGERRLWLDTTNNIVKMYAPNSSSFEEVALPFAIASTSGVDDKFSSIDQVFNGFGYIGNTIFMLPEVEVLIPDGRNEDGSLKNIKFTNTILRQRTYTNKTEALDIRSDGWFGDIAPSYNAVNNLLTVDGSDRWMNAGLVDSDSTGRIESIEIKQVFHEVDYSDTEWASVQGKPSDKYVDLTLGATGSTYKAPANGWFYMQGQGSEAGVETWIECEVRKDEASAYLYREGRYSPTNNVLRLLIPVLKGRCCVMTYSSRISQNKALRFIYDEGAK